MPLDAEPKPETVYAVCPHDCPSTCALEVERLGARAIGRVRGSRGNPYTDGVVCAKVARYAERVHHPGSPDPAPAAGRRERQGQGGLRAEVSWEAALDETAEALLRAEQRFGAETVWPYFYAGTMGHVQRDGIERLQPRQGLLAPAGQTVCVTLAESGWLAGVGVKAGRGQRGRSGQLRR